MELQIIALVFELIVHRSWLQLTIHCASLPRQGPDLDFVENLMSRVFRSSLWAS